MLVVTSGSTCHFSLSLIILTLPLFLQWNFYHVSDRTRSTIAIGYNTRSSSLFSFQMPYSECTSNQTLGSMVSSPSWQQPLITMWRFWGERQWEVHSSSPLLLDSLVSVLGWCNRIDYIEQYNYYCSQLQQTFSLEFHLALHYQSSTNYINFVLISLEKLRSTAPLVKHFRTLVHMACQSSSASYQCQPEHALHSNGRGAPYELCFAFCMEHISQLKMNNKLKIAIYFVVPISLTVFNSSFYYLHYYCYLVGPLWHVGWSHKVLSHHSLKNRNTSSEDTLILWRVSFNYRQFVPRAYMPLFVLSQLT